MRSRPDGLGDEDSTIDIREISLLRLVQQLGAEGTPLCDEFAEMIHVDAAADAPAFLRRGAAGELMDEPATGAEQTAARILCAVVVYAREAELDNDALVALMRRAARYVSRFESYVAERALS
jgi:hypothetical protein